jgi:hypothetical protein
MASTGPSGAQCLKSWATYVTSSPELLSDGELSQLAGDLWNAGPLPLYEAELNASAPLSFVLGPYARLGHEPLVSVLGAMDGRRLRP